jgi:HEAT repeat protein
MVDCKKVLEDLNSENTEELREAAFQAGEAECLNCVPRLSELLQSDNLGVQEAADQALRKLGGPQTVQSVIPLLRSESAPVRNLAMDILRDVGNQDFDSLVELMHDNDPDIRIFTSDILGSTDNALAVNPLCEALLKDPEVNVRYQAAVSLGDLARPEAAKCLNSAMQDEEWIQFAVIEALSKIRDDSSVGVLVKSLSKSSDLISSMIVEALGEMGNVKAVTMLLARLDSSPTALRNKIVKAVVGILGGKSLTLLSEGEREKLRQYLVTALKDSDEDIQDAAIAGLAYIGMDEASKAILELAQGMDFEHHTERYDRAVDALARIGMTPALEKSVKQGKWLKARAAVLALGKIAGPEAERVLMENFWSGDRDLQRESAKALAEAGSGETAKFFIGLLDEHEDGDVIKQALTFLGEHGGEETGDKLFEFLQHPYDDVKEAALDACVNVNGRAMSDRFKELFQSPEPLDRLMAVYALGRMGIGEHIDQLRDALEDEVPDIRKVALEAFGRQCSGLAEYMPLLVARLGDENKDVRLSVVELMGACTHDEAVEHLRNALRDEDDWVRVRAAEALGARKVHDAVPELIGLLHDPNRLVALKAVEALGLIGGRQAFRALLDVLNTDQHELVSAAEEAVEKIQAEEEGS